jgi:hypothetical protein
MTSPRFNTRRRIPQLIPHRLLRDSQTHHPVVLDEAKTLHCDKKPGKRTPRGDAQSRRETPAARTTSGLGGHGALHRGLEIEVVRIADGA